MGTKCHVLGRGDKKCKGQNNLYVIMIKIATDLSK